jgi:hypothetical protein
MERSVPPVDVTLTPVAEPDFPVLRDLAEAIWRQHYSAIISAAQVDYMLAGRFSDDALRQRVQAADRWLELLRVSCVPVGYCGYELAGMDDDGEGWRAGSPKARQNRLKLVPARAVHETAAVGGEHPGTNVASRRQGSVVATQKVLSVDCFRWLPQHQQNHWPRTGAGMISSRGQPDHILNELGPGISDSGSPV